MGFRWELTLLLTIPEGRAVTNMEDLEFHFSETLKLHPFFFPYTREDLNLVKSEYTHNKDDHIKAVKSLPSV